MSQSDSDRSPSESSRRILSALADGDATDSEAARAFQAWRDDADARSSWHAYQLIGDVLRSEDLAARPAADESFLVALRARLATEPVVLAPQPRADARSARRRYRECGQRRRAPFARPLAGPAGDGRRLPGGDRRPQRPAPVRPRRRRIAGLARTPASERGAGVGRGQRRQRRRAHHLAQTQAAADQLAPYLAAHRQSTMSGPFQMPGGDIRNVSLVQPAR